MIRQMAATAICVLGLSVAVGCSVGSSDIQSVCIGSECFQVETVKTPEARRKGLMHRTQLAPNAGMLFVFDNASIYPFWMKDTLIPLDIIWLSEDWQVVFVKHNAQPLDQSLITPTRPARYVLEINGGNAERLKLQVGDYLRAKK